MGLKRFRNLGRVGGGGCGRFLSGAQQMEGREAGFGGGEGKLCLYLNIT